MMTIISPAKNMRPPEKKEGQKPLTMPVYIDRAKEIGAKLKTYGPWDFQELMRVNEKLAQDCFDRMQFIRFDNMGTAAVETYDGIQYKYMDPMTFSERAKEFAERHLRILSGLYGCLRPYDSIYEYRLEMLTKLEVGGAKDLYRYWKEDIYREVAKDDRVICNLASEEYAKTVRRYLKPEDRFVTCVFQVMSKGGYRVLATAAKMARGRMVRYIMEHQIDTIEGLKGFCDDGYRFEPALSTASELVFLQS